MLPGFAYGAAWLGPEEQKAAVHWGVWQGQEPEAVPLGVLLGKDKQENGKECQESPILAALFVLPRMTASTTYDDNILLTENNKNSDLLTSIAPGLSLQAESENSRISADLSVEAIRYRRYSGEDRENLHASLKAEHAAGDDAILGAYVHTAQDHENRDSPEDPGPAFPLTRIATVGVGAEYLYDPRPLQVRVSLDTRRLHYSNALFTSIADRDRDSARLEARFAYFPLEEVGLFVQPAYVLDDYRHSADASGFNRDARTTELLGGVMYDVTELTSLEIGIGKARMNPEDSRLEDTEALTLQARLVWNPLEFVTVHSKAWRSVSSTSLAGVSGLVRSGGEVGAIYAFEEDIHFRADVGVESLDYSGAGRKDDDRNAGVATEYFFSPSVSASVGYRFKQRDSNLPGESFDDNAIMASISISL